MSFYVDGRFMELDMQCSEDTLEQSVSHYLVWALFLITDWLVPDSDLRGECIVANWMWSQLREYRTPYLCDLLLQGREIV